MFNWFKTTKTPLFGEDLFERFKELIATNDDIKLALYLIDGNSQLPFNLVNKAKEIKGVLFSLTSITGLKDVDLIKCAASKKWGPIEDRLSKMTEVMKIHRNDNAMKFKALSRWSDENNVPEMSSFDAPNYKQKGMARDPAIIQSMRFLHLSNLGLKRLPDEISVMPLLQAMCINKNLLTDLPDSLGNISGLQRLDAEDNNLVSLPKTIGKLKYLHTIDLDKNHIQSLPSELSDCNCLKKLRIGEQKHGMSLDRTNSPLDEASFAVLQSLNSRGCDIRF